MAILIDHQLNQIAGLSNIKENVTINSSTGASGTIAFDVLTQSILYNTVAATANWTLNIRGSAAKSFESITSNNQSLTITFINTNGATAYFLSQVQIDGTNATVRWQNSSPPSSGTAGAIDIYVFTIIKINTGTFTVLASQTKFS